MDKYQEIEMIGQGSFGMVYKYRNAVNSEIVAVKKITFKNTFEGVPSSVIREVSLLKEMEHDNIVRLLNVVSEKNCIYLVFEYLDFDLKKLMSTYPEIIENPSTIKMFLHQILCGVEYCHSHKILHRDLKPQNLLIDIYNRNVKLADFGLARAFDVPLKKYTREVVTLWYRAPEVLLGAPQYSTPVDIWAVGCIFAELVNRKPLFAGNCQINQIFTIFRMLGTPSEETWPGVTSFCNFVLYLRKDTPKDLAEVFPSLEPAGVELVSEMLRLDPSRRITAHQALQHAYFNKF